MKRCTRCVLPQSYPGIEFDDAGVCNYCRTYKKMTYKGKEALNKFLGSFRNNDGKYDCIIGISGGRDSSYALYYLVKVCNLRVLAYTADHGFVPEAAKINIQKMVDILNVDLVSEKHDFLTRCIRNNISSWLRKPSCAMIPMICCGCRFGMLRGLLKCAKKHRVPIVVFGSGATIETCKFKRTFFTTNVFGRMIGVRKSALFSVLFGLLYETIKNPFYFLKSINMLVYLKEYLYFFHLERVQRLLYPNQKILRFYRYIEWDEDKIVSTIKSQLNWMRAVESASSWRFDCRVSFLKNYLLREYAGFTEKDDILSSMVRENIITREETFERLKAENIIPQKLISELFDEIGLDPSELSVALARNQKNALV